ncbi:MAG: Uncharacterized conserved membrane protein, UPF0127 family [Chloroflexi bacterium]|nr:MAG: Uncharacterized conserved membrane protein, UPF0127 family [Chloroflexota bacterium]
MNQRALVRRLLLLAIAIGVVLLAVRPGELGAQNATAVSLEAGWNNVAYGGETLLVDDALTIARPSIESVWQWRAGVQEWVVAFINSDAPDSLQSLATGTAYWIRATQAVHWQWRAQIRFQSAQLAIDREAAATLTIEIELADTPTHRACGLMFREQLPDDSGMLFLFPADTGGGFWMRNTLIPLSIAFIGADGRIQEIRDMQPLDETSVRPADAYRWALEVNQGWFAANTIAVGDRVRLTGS